MSIKNLLNEDGDGSASQKGARGGDWTGDMINSEQTRVSIEGRSIGGSFTSPLTNSDTSVLHDNDMAPNKSSSSLSGRTPSADAASTRQLFQLSSSPSTSSETLPYEPFSYLEPTEIFDATRQVDFQSRGSRKHYDDYNHMHCNSKQRQHQLNQQQVWYADGPFTCSWNYNGTNE
jgi:hypothetical protein